MATLRLFASARDAAGTGSTTVDAGTVGDVLAQATARYGPHFHAVLATCKVWVNGEEAALDMTVRAGDEVAVLPPVSGGCR